MSELLDYLKDLYLRAKEEDFEWKPIHPNNLPQNPVSGIYIEFNFPRDGKYNYIKYSIQYMPRIDKKGRAYYEEGIKYFAFYELRGIEFDKPFEIPAPAKDEYGVIRSRDHNAVNDFGLFKYIFEDEKTAKEAIKYQLLHIIYPYTYILSDEEVVE